ncbi:MAG: helix-turn-helix domain-containing protein [Micropepsaceae bacterium]
MSHLEFPHDRRKEERREAAHAFKRAEILAAAKRVMARVGAKGMTIRAVASEAGYVPGAVYFYFDSKSAILADLAVHELAGLTRELKSSTSKDAADLASRAADAFATASNIFELDTGKRASPGSERALMGRLISLFQTVSEPLALDDLPPEQAQARALGLSAASIGLATLARTGRLQKLGVTSGAVLREIAHCLKTAPKREEKTGT